MGKIISLPANTNPKWQKQMTNNKLPLILAPAGNKASFLSALAAGADAVYCGLKNFSARMEAKNFSVEELSSLAHLARKKGTKVYVALNSLIKPNDIDHAGSLLDRLNTRVRPDALIIQDPALVQLARQTGFPGELHLSTLANVSFPMALKQIRALKGIKCVVVPRELNIDEIKSMALACPKGVDLEVFVHGALCYGVSGRCYWSSYLGGKSGLRGMCVQPCRRFYSVRGDSKKFFSCKDLSLDVLVKVLLSVPQVKAWKIEGRKKSAHYVYYTIKAYQMLRDHISDPQKKKAALELLEWSLGRTGTHYNFLPQRPQDPVAADSQTGSGLLVGTLKGAKQKNYIIPREELLPGDVLRVGYEDESWHSTCKVGKYVPKKGRLDLKLSLPRNSSRITTAKNIPVFLTDRREKFLEEMLSKLEEELTEPEESKKSSSKFHARLPKRTEIRAKSLDLKVIRNTGRIKFKGRTGIWLSKDSVKNSSSGTWWWLPPVIWPEQENEWKELIELALKKGGRIFVLNAPWQAAFFKNRKNLELWAGPFCNLSNPLALSTARFMGFDGAIVSPELGREDYLQLAKHSPLPLGIVISGNWPLSISRILPDNIKSDKPFTSPKGEQAWAKKYGSDIWIYPNWQLDLISKKDLLQKAGYSLFVHLAEPLPDEINLKKRPGIWNWDIGLL